MRSVFLGLAGLLLTGCMAGGRSMEEASELTGAACAASCNDALRGGGYPCSDGEDEHADLMACACAPGPSACGAYCGEQFCAGRSTPQFQSPHVASLCEACMLAVCGDALLTCEGRQ